MSVQLTTSPELQLKLNSITPEEAARFIALSSVYLHPPILTSEYYFSLALKTATARIQKFCPGDEYLNSKLEESRRVIEALHSKKSGQGREESGQGSGVGGQ